MLWTSSTQLQTNFIISANIYAQILMHLNLKEETESVWFEDPVHTSQWTLSASVIKTGMLML